MSIGGMEAKEMIRITNTPEFQKHTKCKQGHSKDPKRQSDGARMKASAGERAKEGRAVRHDVDEVARPRRSSLTC
ncbi:hypothetical protein V2J09_022009 [Rumex salicifolius]